MQDLFIHRHPILSMCFHPRKSIRAIVEERGVFWWFLLASLAGIGEALDKSLFYSLGDTFSWKDIVMLAVPLGIAVGILLLFLVAFLILLTGKIFSGKAHYRDICHALAWSTIPLIFFGFVFYLPMVPWKGQSFFQEPTIVVQAGQSINWLFFIYGLMEVTCTTWAVVILFLTISEVQKISPWRSLLNVMLSLLCLLLLCIPIAIAMQKFA